MTRKTWTEKVVENRKQKRQEIKKEKSVRSGSQKTEKDVLGNELSYPISIGFNPILSIGTTLLNYLPEISSVGKGYPKISVCLHNLTGEKERYICISLLLQLTDITCRKKVIYGQLGSFPPS